MERSNYQMDYQINKAFSLLILVQQHIFNQAGREVEIQNLHTENSLSAKRLANNNRQTK